MLTALISVLLHIADVSVTDKMWKILPRVDIFWHFVKFHSLYTYNNYKRTLIQKVYFYYCLPKRLHLANCNNNGRATNCRQAQIHNPSPLTEIHWNLIWVYGKTPSYNFL